MITRNTPTTASARAPRQRLRRATLARHLASVAMLATLALAIAPLGAQTTTDSTAERTPRPAAGEPGPLFTMRDAVLGLAFAGTTVALFPLDERLAKHLQNTGAQANKFFGHAATGLEAFASPGAYVIGGSLYAFGRLTHSERVADLGWHGTEAVLVADAVTGLLKGMLGRARPYVSADTNPRDFKFLGGFGSTEGRTSFPSGHTTSAFAAAAAVTAETRRLWPQSTIVVAPLMYGGATLVGVSRMYHNKHWASDVALGAAIGTFGGLKVVQYSHAHPHNLVDRLILRTAVVPDGRGGLALAWSVPAP